ncbi:MAG: hypothetical protein H6577_20340 [Lewinellaceae bacterium]|nr:hypothetical protein [Saprospiraceae bacterium]MCB9340480.1 hypothetical protein [Lewinellaceae bacterium]
MKANQLIFSAVLAIGLLTASVTDAQTPFTQGSNVIHAGFGLGGYGYSVYNAWPAGIVSYDRGIVDDLGIGNLGIGGVVALKHYSYKDLDGFTFNRVFVGARGTYHFHFVNSDKLDFYGGVMAGAFFYFGDFYGSTTYNSGPFGSALAGINYWFTPGIGVWAEAGYGIGLISGGISFGFGGN